TAFTATGLVNGNNITAVSLSSTGSPATANVGTYPIVASAAVGTGLSNYSISYTDGTLTVTPATLTITASNQVKCQGLAYSFTNADYTVAGLVNGNTVTAATLNSLGATAATAAGTYTITPSAAVGTGLSNYNIVYVNGTFTVNALPVAAITSATTVLCGPSASIVLSTSGGANYQWFLNNTAISGALNSSITASSVGNYTVRITTAQGCVANATNSVTLTQLFAPVASFSFDRFCTNTAVNFTNQSTVNTSGAVSYVWSDNVGNSSNSTNAAFTYSTANNYSVKLIVRSNVCSNLADSITRVVAVEAPRTAVRLATQDAILGENLPLQARTFGTRYTWTPSTGLSNSFISNPTTNITAEQEYRIRIEAASGCITVDSLRVRIQQAYNLFVPNIFTPNGDGVNDRLMIVPVGIKELQFFRVFDRSGKRLFETSNITSGWDGTYGGVLQPLATYVWTARGLDKDGNSIYREGTVTLLR
ncbi:MAG: hypothetical protein EAZ47_04815, partial [Bacteroidetes bacterium]